MPFSFLEGREKQQQMQSMLLAITQQDYSSFVTGETHFQSLQSANFTQNLHKTRICTGLKMRLQNAQLNFTTMIMCL
jgi:hypothetical protein